jgi:TorA maturation chaperone TorD
MSAAPPADGAGSPGGAARSDARGDHHAGVTAPVVIAPKLDPEDRLRADLYALFARLYFSPPDAELLRLVASSPLFDRGEVDSPVVRAGKRLAAACSVMDADAAADEYDALFGGIGRSEISLFGSYYVGDHAPGAGGMFLVDLRAALAAAGLGRKTGENLPEDHLAAVLETMRFIIERAGASGLAEQRAFFTRFVGSWYRACCDAISASNLANFYRTVTECAREYLTVENQAFDIG